MLVHTPGAATWCSCPPHLSWPGPSPCQGTYQPRFDWRVHANSSGLFLHGEREWRRTARVGTVGGAGGLCLLTRRGEERRGGRGGERGGEEIREGEERKTAQCKMDLSTPVCSPASLAHSLLPASGLTVSPSFLAPESTPRARFPSWAPTTALQAHPSLCPPSTPNPHITGPGGGLGTLYTCQAPLTTFPHLSLTRALRAQKRVFLCPPSPPVQGLFQHRTSAPSALLTVHCCSGHTRHPGRAA